VTIVADAFQ